MFLSIYGPTPGMPRFTILKFKLIFLSFFSNNLSIVYGSSTALP